MKFQLTHTLHNALNVHATRIKIHEKFIFKTVNSQKLSVSVTCY